MSCSVHASCSLASPFYHGDDKSSCFSRASARHANNIHALKDVGHGLALDGRGQPVAIALDGPQYWHTEAHGICVAHSKAGRLVSRSSASQRESRTISAGSGLWICAAAHAV